MEAPGVIVYKAGWVPGSQITTDHQQEHPGVSLLRSDQPLVRMSLNECNEDNSLHLGLIVLRTVLLTIKMSPNESNHVDFH